MPSANGRFTHAMKWSSAALALSAVLLADYCKSREGPRGNTWAIAELGIFHGRC